MTLITEGKILGIYQTGSPEWHAARRWRIGGSDIGAVMGWSPWKTRNDLLHAKREDIAQKRRPSPAETAGTLLEPSILEWGTTTYGYAYDEDASAATWVNNHHDWILYNPDSITTDGIIVECKTTSNCCPQNGWGTPETNQIPQNYMAQVQWGMLTTGLQQAHLILLHGAINNKPCLGFRRYIIPACNQTQQQLFASGKEFHTQLTQKQPLPTTPNNKTSHTPAHQRKNIATSQ